MEKIIRKDGGMQNIFLIKGWYLQSRQKTATRVNVCKCDLDDPISVTHTTCSMFNLLAKETQLSQSHYFLGCTQEDSHLWQISKLKRLQQSCRFCHNFTDRGERSAQIFIQLSNNWNSSHIITQMGRAASAARKLPGPISFSESKCHKCHINLFESHVRSDI